MSARRSGRRSAGAAAAAFALLAAASCAQIIGLEPFSGNDTGGASSAGGSGPGGATGSHGSTTTGSTGIGGTGGGAGGGATGGATGGAGGGCGTGDTCAPTVQDWTGPEELVTGASPSCSAGWTPDQTGSIRPASLQCSGCNCHTPPSACQAVFRFYSTSASPCDSETNQVTANIGCNPTSQLPGGITVDPPSSTNAECGLLVGDSCDKPAIESVVLCAPPSAGTCDAGQCVGAHTSALCVWRTGDVPCPSEYPTAASGEIYTAYALGACACGPVQNIDCTVSRLAYSSNTTCTATGTILSTCSAASGAIMAVEYEPRNTGSCAGPTAAETANGRISVCCR